MKLDATVVAIGGGSPVVLNEVLSRNATAPFYGWIEIHNPSGAAADLSDLSLSNEVDIPRKFVFANGTTIPAGGYLVIDCNGLAASTATNSGFSLDGGGDDVFLFEKLANGGGLRDAIVFGRQLTNLSIGRVPNGSGPWSLTVPTRSGLNTAAGLGAITSIKVNEWLANPAFGTSWFELYNGGAQPVLLSGNYLTDNLTNRNKYLLPPLTFLGTGADAWWRVEADNTQAGLNGHVNFTLNPSGEAIGLFSGNGTQLEVITFGPQTFNVSSGRFPDGTSNIITFPETPTPGTMNLVIVDMDGDGLADSWEMANFGNLSQNGSGDADGDGRTNLEEYRAGTDPRNPGNYLQSSIANSGGSVVVRFTAAPNKSYTVQYKDALTDPTWLKLSDIAPDTSARNLEVGDPLGGSRLNRFYRVITPVQP